MKQTAVEFIEEYLLLNYYDTMRYAGIDLSDVIEQAKEMEKEQHGKTWDNALDKYEVRAGNYMRAYEDFDEYYNETFKSE
jgi:hypothetical protein